jgi:predicted lipoprotein with Yx(FWY)xxD motif
MLQTLPGGTGRPSRKDHPSRWRRNASSAALLAAAGALAAAAGCGGGGGSSDGSGSGYQPPASSAAPTGGASAGTIKAANTGNLGQILVDGQSRTLYLFEKDQGNKSSCADACASVWPPATTSASPKPGSGVDASKLGTTKRSDGTTQVSYAGHPLYYYAPDGTTAGSTQGQGLDQFGAKWFVLSPSGSAVTK